DSLPQPAGLGAKFLQESLCVAGIQQLERIVHGWEYVQQPGEIPLGTFQMLAFGAFVRPLPLDMTIVNGKLDTMKFLCRLAVLFLLLAAPGLCLATPDLKFDVVTFCCGCSSSICQEHFDHLNFPTTNGHYIA